MGINLVTYYNSTVTPQDDALIYENALPASGMIYGGNVTIKNANTLHITAGHGALCGRKFTIEEADIPVILTSSGTLNGRLYIHMDLSDTGSPISLEIERAASLTPVIQQSNVNINDGIYEINLATFQISTSTVSNLAYVAPFIKYEFAKEVIIAPVEKTSTASTNYAVGKHLILDKVLYVVTATITAGQIITPGTNVTVSDTVEKQIEDANAAIAGKVNTSDIANNLTTTAAGKVLDARQGKALNDVLVPKANQTVIATRQTNLTASRAYKVGEQFIYNNVLYKATAAISSGGTINIGSGGNATTADNITTQISNNANWVLVDPVASIMGSSGGAKPTFYQRGKELMMINFPHPNTGATITITFKSDYSFKCDIGFSLLNYSSWNKDYQVFLPYTLTAANRLLTSEATTQFAYFRLPAPVVFPLL